MPIIVEIISNVVIDYDSTHKAYAMPFSMDSEFDMPKADILLPNGTKVVIDGSVEDIKEIMAHSSQMAAPGGSVMSESHQRHDPVPKSTEGGGQDENPDIAAIVARIKDCDEAEQIERRVLDHRDVLNRVLLCLWIVDRDFRPTMGLTSGEIEKITDQLGVKVGISNASTILSGRAKAFVSGDTVRKQGGAVRYKLNRRGVLQFESILSG
jgi:hypothetical protein